MGLVLIAWHLISTPFFPATLTHTFLYYRKQIWTQARRSIEEQPDIHARLMSRYRQVPEWWYAMIFRTCSTGFLGRAFSEKGGSVYVRFRSHRHRGLAHRYAGVGFRLGPGMLPLPRLVIDTQLS